MGSPNTKISRGNWSLVVVCKFIAERIITYRNRNENPGILVTKRDFQLQTGNLSYKTGLSVTKRDSWIINGILGLLFTSSITLYHLLNCFSILIYCFSIKTCCFSKNQRPHTAIRQNNSQTLQEIQKTQNLQQDSVFPD